MFVHGNKRLLTLVMQNLLGNAIKYSANSSPARIAVGAEYAEGKRIYYVRDNGAGFDMQYADKLFRPSSGSMGKMNSLDPESG